MKIIVNTMWKRCDFCYTEMWDVENQRVIVSSTSHTREGQSDDKIKMMDTHVSGGFIRF
jgi:hypothetical protein